MKRKRNDDQPNAKKFTKLNDGKRLQVEKKENEDNNDKKIEKQNINELIFEVLRLKKLKNRNFFKKLDDLLSFFKDICIKESDDIGINEIRTIKKKVLEKIIPKNQIQTKILKFRTLLTLTSYKVFDFCDPIDLLTLKLTCKRTFNIISWRMVSFSFARYKILTLPTMKNNVKALEDESTYKSDIGKIIKDFKPFFLRKIFNIINHCRDEYEEFFLFQKYNHFNQNGVSIISLDKKYLRGCFISMKGDIYPELMQIDGQRRFFKKRTNRREKNKIESELFNIFKEKKIESLLSFQSFNNIKNGTSILNGFSTPDEKETEELKTAHDTTSYSKKIGNDEIDFDKDEEENLQKDFVEGDYEEEFDDWKKDKEFDEMDIAEEEEDEEEDDKFSDEEDVIEEIKTNEILDKKSRRTRREINYNEADDDEEEEEEISGNKKKKKTEKTKKKERQAKKKETKPQVPEKKVKSPAARKETKPQESKKVKLPIPKKETKKTKKEETPQKKLIINIDDDDDDDDNPKPEKRKENGITAAEYNKFKKKKDKVIIDIDDDIDPKPKKKKDSDKFKKKPKIEKKIPKINSNGRKQIFMEEDYDPTNNYCQQCGIKIGKVTYKLCGRDCCVFNEFFIYRKSPY